MVRLLKKAGGRWNEAFVRLVPSTASYWAFNMARNSSSLNFRGRSMDIVLPMFDVLNDDFVRCMDRKNLQGTFSGQDL